MVVEIVVKSRSKNIRNIALIELILLTVDKKSVVVIVVLIELLTHSTVAPYRLNGNALIKNL